MLIKKKGKAAIYVIKREGEQQEKEWTRNYIWVLTADLINLSAVSATIYSPFHLK